MNEDLLEQNQELYERVQYLEAENKKALGIIRDQIVRQGKMQEKINYYKNIVSVLQTDVVTVTKFMTYGDDSVPIRFTKAHKQLGKIIDFLAREMKNWK